MYIEGLLLRGNNTNNYAEATFKLVKDHLLKRNRCFNVVELFEFIVGKFNNYYAEKLLEFINGTRSESKTPKTNLKIVQIVNGNIIIIDDNSMIIKFDLKLSLCSCKEGNGGRKCAHSYFLATKNYRVSTENCSHLYDEKKILYKLATGSDLENVDIFASIHSKNGQCPQSINGTFNFFRDGKNYYFLKPFF